MAERTLESAEVTRTRVLLGLTVVALAAAAVAVSTGGEPATIGPPDDQAPAGPALSNPALGVLGPWPPSVPRPRAVLRDPIDPWYQRALKFGERSHWLQPWRAYLDTVSADRLREALGINFNVAPDEADTTARLLASAGIRRARVELPWGAFDYAHPRRLTDPRAVRRVFRALVRYGIRPLVLLNAHHGAPCPARFFGARLVASARAGDRHVRLDRRTTEAVVPGRTGLNAPDDGKAADILFTSVAAGGIAELSKPLPRDFGAGEHPAATLRYAPFEGPREADGSRNPAFEATLGGWLSYVGAAVRIVREYLGSRRFDVEIWNELSFGSDFLDARTYYNPARESGHGDVTEAVLKRTVAYLREPERGLAGLGIANGFASQRPWDSGTTSPRGLTALAKHPYADPRRFPASAVVDGVVPLDATGRQDAVSEGTDKWRDKFVPRYTSHFPEYFLSAIQTEHLIRDLSPFTTSVYGTTRHGRHTHPAGSPPPHVWVTEWNLDPEGARTSSGNGPLSSQARRVQAKALLRGLVAFVNKGVDAFYIFAATGHPFGIVEPSFFGMRRRIGRYRGGRSGGVTISAIRRLSATFESATAKIARPRQLRLLAIGDYERRIQFAGDGTLRRPPLYNRDVVAFLPFQLDARRFVVATYVMTRNVARSLSPERFAFAIGGLPSCEAAVTAADPLDGRRVPVQRVSCTERRLVVSLPLTDSPRLLRIRLRR